MILKMDANNIFGTFKLRWYGLWFLMCAVITTLLIKSNSVLQYLIMEFFILILLLLPIILWIKKYKINARKLFGDIPKIGEFVKPIILVFQVELFSGVVFVIMFHFLSLLIDVQSIIDTFYSITEAYYYELKQSIFLIVANILMSAIITPVAEEIIFRVMLLYKLNEKLKNINLAIIISSLIFGVLHGQYFVAKTLFGIIMSVVYIRSEKIIIPMVAHGFWNLYMELTFLCSENNDDIKFNDIDLSLFIISPGLLYTLLSLPFIIVFLYKNWPSNEKILPYYLNE